MATTNQNSDAPAFTGEFRHRIEGKNRITVPSAWRFGEEIDLFMIRRTGGKCIAVMPRCEVERIKADADAMAPEDRSSFLQIFGRRLRQVTLDKAGRISIPDEFCKQLGMEGQVVLSGSVDTFDIWNVPDFEAAHPENDDHEANMLRRLGI